MFVSTALGIALLAPAAPVPAPPPVPASTVDRNQAIQFSHMVYNMAIGVMREHYLDPKLNDLMAGAVRGLYEEVGQKVPEDVQAAITRAGDSSTDLLAVLVDSRMRLGSVAALSGPRALIAAINGFKYGSDMHSGLSNPRANHSFVSVELDYGLGIELDGVYGQRWSIYRMERGLATGAYPPTGCFGPIPKVEAVPSPANFPWKIRRVVPGSPAQRAGLKPGDTITQLNGTEITAENAGKMFIGLAFPVTGFDPNTGQPLSVKRTFKLKRDVGAPFDVSLESQQYTPEAVYGVIRTADGKWDCLLDRENKIGYLRLGPIEERADEAFAEMLDSLAKQGCRALILDLRWCPGGYVTPGTRIAGMFLKTNETIAQVITKVNPGSVTSLPAAYRASAPFAGKCTDLPVLVLVGSETLGGGELIACALQENGRCQTMGQRTAGRAAIQGTLETGFGGMQFKVTTGATLRPNGKSRGKLPDSKPTDDWGIKPDAGLEVPLTADISAKLRNWADDQALRPAGSNEALPFDDPQKDPLRAAAMAHLRKVLGEKKRIDP
jgi:C-terminal processing protease CtpA/Prc